MQPGRRADSTLTGGPQAEHARYGEVAVLDLDRLVSSTLGDAALQREVVGMFQTQVDDLAERLASGVNAEDWKFLSHTLRGTAAAIGAVEIALLGERWERDGLRPGSAVSAELQSAWRRFEIAVSGTCSAA